MHGFYTILSAETASFRDPGGQLYHSTLPLPPVSTIIGIGGAALGLNFQETWNFFKNNDIKVGVRGSAAGKGLDLWKYQKIVSNEVRGDIVKREFLFKPVYELYYGSVNQSVLEKLRSAFLNPAWALSLGTSDDITYIKKISRLAPISAVEMETTEFGNCLIPGDQTDIFAFNWALIANTPVRTSLELPVVKQIPIDFEFSKDGERKACRYKPFTFLSLTHCLKVSFAGYDFGEKKIPLISINEEA